MSEFETVNDMSLNNTPSEVKSAQEVKVSQEEVKPEVKQAGVWTLIVTGIMAVIAFFVSIIGQIASIILSGVVVVGVGYLVYKMLFDKKKVVDISMKPVSDVLTPSVVGGLLNL
jgi:hypothetical protein